MPISPRQKQLCSYRYDALDRSIDWAPIGQAGIQRFHCNDRLATEIQGTVKHSIFQHDDHVLAQQQHMDDKVDTTLLTTDLQGSVLNALNALRLHPIAYMPYGHRPPGNGLLSLLGFNGERPDPMTGHYHLGNGYRQFNPVLMRFNSPDSLSPFGKGGLNAYVYCGGNPVNRVDPNGHTYKIVEHMKEIFLLKTNRPMSIDTESIISSYAKRLVDQDSIDQRTITTMFMHSRNELQFKDWKPRPNLKLLHDFEANKITTLDEKIQLRNKIDKKLDKVNRKVNILSEIKIFHEQDASVNSHLKNWINYRAELEQSKLFLNDLPIHNPPTNPVEAAANIRKPKME